MNFNNENCQCATLETQQLASLLCNLEKKCFTVKVQKAFYVLHTCLGVFISPFLPHCKHRAGVCLRNDTVRVLATVHSYAVPIDIFKICWHTINSCSNSTGSIVISLNDIFTFLHFSLSAFITSYIMSSWRSFISKKR